jgi:hypothetical protein
MASSWDKRHNDEGDGSMGEATSWNRKTTKIRNQKSGQKEEEDDERETGNLLRAF